MGKETDVTLRQVYRAGKSFLLIMRTDYTVYRSDDGQVKRLICCSHPWRSSYTFVWASLKQDLPSWIDAHVKAFAFFGGVPEILFQTI